MTDPDRNDPWGNGGPTEGPDDIADPDTDPGPEPTPHDTAEADRLLAARTADDGWDDMHDPTGDDWYLTGQDS